MTRKLPRMFVRATSTAIFAAGATIGLSACSETSGPEEGATVEDVQEEDAGEELAYEGVYDDGFYDEIDGYDGETVTVSADVDQIFGDNAFSIAGGDVEALLIVSADGASDLDEGSPVQVTGTVHKSFVLTDVEEDLGLDLGDDLELEFDSEPYIEATSIDTSVPKDEQ